MILRDAHCRELGPEDRLESTEDIDKLLAQLNEGWAIDLSSGMLSRQFVFSGFEQVMIFTNFVAWLSNQEDHHPRMTLEYKTCKIEYQTHSVSGLSINDFICAARIDAYLQDYKDS
jgi:4a-hydroxytetrahydrobiopterin dehydratase